MSTVHAKGSFAQAFTKNVFFKGVGEVAIRLLSFAFIVFVARVLGDAQFGIINFSYSFALLFVVIVDFGLNPLMVRDSARDASQTKQLFLSLLGIKLILALLFLVAVGIGLLIIQPDAIKIKITIWLTLFVMLNSFTEYICAVFHGHQKMQFEAIAMTVQKLALLILGGGALYLGLGLMGVAAAYAAAGIAGLVVAIIILVKGKLLLGAWKPNSVFLKYTLKQALPLTLTTLFINLYFRIDMTLLEKLSTDEQIGWYGAAHKCIEVLMVIPAILVVASFPGFSKLYHENKDKMERAATQILRFLLLLGLPLAVGAVVVGVPLMVMIFGQEYAPSGQALGWLTFALMFIFLNYPLSFFLISGEKQKVNAIVSGLAVLVSVGSNLLLIPRYGYLGAAASAVITEVFLFSAYYVMVNRLMFKFKWHVAVLKIGASSLIMGCVIWLLKDRSVIIVIPVGVMVYGLVLLLLKAINSDDLALVKKLVKRSW